MDDYMSTLCSETRHITNGNDGRLFARRIVRERSCNRRWKVVLAITYHTIDATSHSRRPRRPVAS